MASKAISINRAPVLTLWAATVTQRPGFDEDEALSLGKALAGFNAQVNSPRNQGPQCLEPVGVE